MKTNHDRWKQSILLCNAIMGVVLQGEYFAPPLHDTVSEIAFYGDIYGEVYSAMSS